MRLSQRYVLVRIGTEATLSPEMFSQALEEAIRHVFGEIGHAKVNLRIIDLEPKSRRAIVRCNTSYLQDLRFALAFVREIEGKPCVLFSERTSGTIRSLRQPKKAV